MAYPSLTMCLARAGVDCRSLRVGIDRDQDRVDRRASTSSVDREFLESRSTGHVERAARRAECELTLPPPYREVKLNTRFTIDSKNLAGQRDKGSWTAKRPRIPASRTEKPPCASASSGKSSESGGVGRHPGGNCIRSASFESRRRSP